MVLPEGLLVSSSLSISSSSLSSPPREKVENIEDDGELPYDVLAIVANKLNCDDLFQFSGVCKSWRSFHKIFWRNFQTTQAPLIVQSSSRTNYKILSFFSIADQKVYSPEMACFMGLRYVGSSSGYLFMANPNHILVLINPFRRRSTKIINTSSLRDNLYYQHLHVLLAFVKGSQEFVLLVICNIYECLHVYHSRNSSWITYLTRENPWKVVVVDFVVLHNRIYVITTKANIGVLSLISTNIEFLELKNTPKVNSHRLKLVNCDGKLLMVDFSPNEGFNVYQINLSTMSFSKMKTLGDITLFFGLQKSCYALSNPGKWGYANNSVYFLNCYDARCEVYSGDDGNLQKFIMPSKVSRSSLLLMDWYFRHLPDEVDYSLDE